MDRINSFFNDTLTSQNLEDWKDLDDIREHVMRSLKDRLKVVQPTFDQRLNCEEIMSGGNVE